MTKFPSTDTTKGVKEAWHNSAVNKKFHFLSSSAEAKTANTQGD